MATKKVDWLVENIENPNVADLLKQDEREKYAGRIVRGFQNDDDSRRDWLKRTEDGLKIAEQITESKSYPWPDAANVKFPLIATAAIQFAARAYPNIIQGTDVVKTKIVGTDPQGQKAARAKRIQRHLSYQCTDEMEGWEEGVDKLLHSLPVIGMCYKKTYFCPLLQRNVSEFCSPLDVVVHEDAKNIETARRVTHKIYLYRNDVLEAEREGMFLDLGADYMESDEEKDAAECFLEQHCWMDLDGDSYEEPYIATVHEDSQTLVRIVPRYELEGIKVSAKGKIVKITPVQYFTPFGFIPSPSGKFHYLGFAHLLGPINESMNTVINQLLDAGTLANMQGGFLGKGIRFQGGTMRFRPGEWKVVDMAGGLLKDNVVPLPVREPSNVLYMLLGLLNDTGMKLASVSDTMTGEAPSQNTPAATTLAMIEQGLKVFTAIYKRIFRSLTAEYKKLYRLNGIYLEDEQYFRVLDEENVIARADYNTKDIDILPVADPSLASDAQRIAKSQALMQTLQLNPSKSGQLEILRQHYEAIGAENIDKILPEEEIQQVLQAPPPPDPKMIKLQLDSEHRAYENKLKSDRLAYDLEKIESEIDQIKAQTAQIITETAAIPLQAQLSGVEAMMRSIQQDTKLEIDRLKAGQTAAQAAGGMNEPGTPEGIAPGGDDGGVGGMAPSPDDLQSPRLSGPNPQELLEASGAGGDLESQLSGSDGNADYGAIGESLRRESGVES